MRTGIIVPCPSPTIGATSPASVPCFVLTVSDTRTLETETSGRAIAELLEAAGHTVVGRTLVRDEPAEVARVVRDAIAGGQVRASSRPAAPASRRATRRTKR